MNENNFYSVFFSELKKKWYVIILLMLIVGGGLMLEKKGAATSPVFVSTSAFSVQVVKVVWEGAKDIPQELHDGGLFLNSSFSDARTKPLTRR